jgi:hypothetical protein
MPFWLDTICVPIHLEELRIRAMNRLRRPYQDAMHVLVLDSYLYTQDSAKISPLEIFARVVCCSRSRRLWTFQEGQLANNLWLQFPDKAVLLEQVFLDMKRALATKTLDIEIGLAYYRSNIMIKINGQVMTKRQSSPIDYRLEPTVRDTREALKVRAVSVPADAALCLFCIMKLNMELVIGLAPDHRMAKFWSEMKKIPVGLFFSTTKKKLSNRGLQWAPASFVGGLDTSHWYLEQCIRPRIDGYPSLEGLRIQAPGLFFSHNLLLLDQSFEAFFSRECVFQTSDRTWYMVEDLEYWHQDRTENPIAGEQVVLLTAQSMSRHNLRRDMFPTPHVLDDIIHGVIGTVTNTDGVSYFAGYTQAVVHKLSLEWQEYYQLVAECVESFVRMECGMPDSVVLSISATTEAAKPDRGDRSQSLVVH